MSEDKKERSVLDGVPVDDKAFPLHDKMPFLGHMRPARSVMDDKGEFIPRLTIVGHCPKCGGPIYGPSSSPVGESPEVRFSCSCHDLVGMTRQT